MPAGAQDCVVMHRSPDGTLVSTAVPANRLPHVRDTTGAGDAFAAGLLVALMAGESAVEATTRAHRVAADAIMRASADAEPDAEPDSRGQRRSAISTGTE